MKLKLIKQTLYHFLDVNNSLFLGNEKIECANHIIKTSYNNNEFDQLVIYWNIKILSTLYSLANVIKIKRPNVNMFE